MNGRSSMGVGVALGVAIGAGLGVAMGNLAVSFLCGPYIMLQVGWRQEEDGTLSMTSVLVSALVAFGWAFVTGILVLSAFNALPI